jgi:hypothetical protein
MVAAPKRMISTIETKTTMTMPIQLADEPHLIDTGNRSFSAGNAVGVDCCVHGQEVHIVGVISDQS